RPRNPRLAHRDDADDARVVLADTRVVEHGQGASDLDRQPPRLLSAVGRRDEDAVAVAGLHLRHAVHDDDLPAVLRADDAAEHYDSPFSVSATICGRRGTPTRTPARRATSLT